MNKKALLVMFLTGFIGLSVHAQQFALKTNLLGWATTTMNIGAEVALSNRSTMSLTACYNPWTIAPDNKIQHWFIQPEYRYWFSHKFSRFYMGVHLLGGAYEVGGFSLPLHAFSALESNYYKGWGVGAGIGIGYNFYISPHWSLEAKAGAGIVRMTYHTLDNPSNERTRYLPIPTEVGISLVYLFKSKR